jgi:hypothetical protein
MAHGLFGNLNSMWDIISDMTTNRLWIYTSIGGSILGAICLAYLSTTRAGLWFYAKIDNYVDYLVTRWGLTWLEQPEDSWRKKYPKITAKIDDLEDRIKQLESK